MNPKRPLSSSSSSSSSSKRRKQSPHRKCAGNGCTARGTQAVKYAHGDLYYCEKCKPMDAVNTHICGLLVVLCTACQKDIAVDVFDTHKVKCPGADMGRKKTCTYEDPANSMARLDLHRHTHTGTLPFPCTQCDHAATTKQNLDEHMVQRHHVPGKYPCPRDDCTFQTNQRRAFTNHMHAHDGIRPHPCPEANCTRAFTQKKDLHRHLRNVHGNGARFFQCGIDNCRYKAGQRGHLKTHQREVHDVGKRTCPKCKHTTRGKIIKFKDPDGQDVLACRTCMWGLHGKPTRREEIWGDLVTVASSIGQLMIRNMAVKTLDGATLYPDLFAILPTFIFHGELDEYGHRRPTYANELGRLRKIITAPVCANKPMIILRMDPDGVTSLSEHERTRAYIDLLEKLITNPPTSGIHVHYMYYRKTNKHLPPEGDLDDGSGMTIYYHVCQ
jgi:hypothetical protein